MSERGESVVGFEVRTTETEVYDDYDEIRVVRIDVLVDFATFDEDRGLASTESLGEAAVYGIDETGLVRAATPHRRTIDGDVEAETPDPVEDGRLLACF